MDPVDIYEPLPEKAVPRVPLSNNLSNEDVPIDEEVPIDDSSVPLTNNQPMVRPR